MTFNHSVFCLCSPGQPSIRRILLGLKVVRPRFAAGAPPRPLTAVHRPPSTGRNEAKRRKTTNGARLCGRPQHR
jgi:hypothetical protein